MLEVVRKKRAFEDIVKQIRQLIEKGRLKQDDQLPTETELSKTFKVSRTTVRDAILSLETMGLLERRQGNGTYVITSGEEAHVQHLAMSLFHEKDDIIEVFSLRKIIEPEVAQLASENKTPKELNELEEILKEQEKEVADGLNRIQRNDEFHRLLARMAKNMILERLLLALIDLLGKNPKKYLLTEERNQKSLQRHHEILAAIKSSNGSAARQAMLRHLEEVEDVLFKKRKEGRKDFRSQKKCSLRSRDSV